MPEAPSGKTVSGSSYLIGIEGGDGFETGIIGFFSDSINNYLKFKLGLYFNFGKVGATPMIKVGRGGDFNYETGNEVVFDRDLRIEELILEMNRKFGKINFNLELEANRIGTEDNNGKVFWPFSEASLNLQIPAKYRLKIDLSAPIFSSKITYGKKESEYSIFPNIGINFEKPYGENWGMTFLGGLRVDLDPDAIPIF